MNDEQPADLSATYYNGKPSARKAVWTRFPPELRTPRFTGEADAARRLFDAPPLARPVTKAIKVSADRTLRAVRALALERGFTVYIPTRDLLRGFRALDPATRKTHFVELQALPALDAIIVGSVVLTRDGYHCGQGNGRSDIEWAILRELGRPAIPVMTIVHPDQFVRYFPAYEHDAPLSFIATPGELITVERPAPPPRTIDWDRIPRERVRAMPILQSLAKRRRT